MMETVELAKLKDYFESKCPAQDLLDAMHDIMIDYLVCSKECGEVTDFAIERISVLNSFYETLRDSVR